MERHQDVPVVRLHEVLLQRHNDVSKKSQMKHPTTSQWYVTKTLLRRLSGMYPRRAISMSLPCPNKTPKKFCFGTSPAQFLICN